MKAILTAVVLFGLSGLALAADAKADPVGTWQCEYKIGDQKRTSTLTIKKDEDKIAGTMSWPDQKETKLKDLKLKDGELTFSAERKVNDMTLTVEYKLKVEGDKIKGKGAVDAGGEKREFDIEGKREMKVRIPESIKSGSEGPSRGRKVHDQERPGPGDCRGNGPPSVPGLGGRAESLRWDHGDVGGRRADRTAQFRGLRGQEAQGPQGAQPSHWGESKGAVPFLGEKPR